MRHERNYFLAFCTWGKNEILLYNYLLRILREIYIYECFLLYQRSILLTVIKALYMIHVPNMYRRVRKILSPSFYIGENEFFGDSPFFIL